MAWIGSADENISLFNATILEEQESEWNHGYAYDDSLVGNQSYYCPAFDGSEGTLEDLLGSFLAYPPTSKGNNMSGVMSFDDLDCFSLRFEALKAPPCITGGGEPPSTSFQRHKTDEAKCELEEINVLAEGGNEKKQIVGVGGGCNSISISNTCDSDGRVTYKKGKKNDHGLPAKNLMAERRRRKKLNDRLFMLRSVVPNISKMDRTSTLGDAVEYLKKLLQRINELHNKPVQSSNNPCLPGSSKFQPLTYMHPGFLCKEMEDYHLSVPYPDAQPTKVGVRTTDGKALNIRMLCSRKPGLLLYTMRALDALGLDVKQAVVSCFNGFALNVFQAEQTMGKNITAEEIKSVMLHTAGYQASLYK